MSIVEKTAGMLMSQLERLDALAVAAGEEMEASVDALRAECERAKAVNETARNIIGLGNLHVQAEALRRTPERPFDPGLMFADGGGDGLRPLGHVPSLPAEAAPAEGAAGHEPERHAHAAFGGRTKMNEMGEFVCDDGLDAFVGGGR